MGNLKKNRGKKFLALGIILSLQLNTVAFAATVVTPDRTQGKNPSVMQAANGTTVVNIRTPNDKGLSHNQYTNLQVGKDGLIFNNSSGMSKTELAGYITGNQYLAGPVSAKVILNEVTGNLPTNLNGYMEIAGNRADLVIANPNGIVGNNFGYINTSRAVLTTGTPILAPDGGLSGFNVNQGNIEINGLGMDAKTTSKAEIYARAARINAGIWAQDLNVVTGSNKIDYATGNVKEVINNEDRGVSLDVAALGGMYAGKIKLVGTAKGLGVNMEGVVSVYDQDLTMTQEGKLLVKNKIAAKTDVNLTSNDSIENTSSIYSGNNITTKATGNVTNTGEIEAGNVNSITSSSAVTNSGTIHGKAIATIHATDNITNTGLIAGESSTNLNTTQSFNNTGTINGGDTSIVATGDVNNTNTGKIYGDNLSIKATNINNLAGVNAPVIAARQDMTLEATTVNNKEHSVLTAEGNMTIKADTVNNNSATIEAGRNMDIQANTLNNTNEHFSTEVQIVHEEDIIELQAKNSLDKYKVGSDFILDQSGHQYGSPEEGLAAGYDAFLLDGSDDDYDIYFNNNSYSSWYRYLYHRTIREDVIKTTDPAKITAGGNLTITGGTVTNDKSTIMAGGTLTANVGTLNNIEGTGKQYIEDNGTTHYYHKEDSGNAWWHEMVTEHDTDPYAPPVIPTDIVVPASTYKANTTPTGSGTIAGLGSYNSMFSTVADSLNKAVGTNYYVETDPNYTNGKNFLSSDYFFTQMSYDPNNVAKRLGDGYYEQKLVSDQVMNLTGKRFTESATSNEEQYKLLLDNAAKFAKDNSLTVGVALTAEEQAKLTESIVWMVEQSVGLPDGRIVKALVPVVYVPQEKTPYGTRGAAVIAAQDININAVNDILNQGTISATDSTKLSANNINNVGGTIKGSNVIIDALNDVNNVGGTLAAEKEMDITAGHNVNMEITTSHAENAKGSRDTINQVAGAYVTGDNAKLNIEAGNDINLKAADIATTGKDSELNIKAGHDVNLDAVQAGASNDIVFDSKNYRHDKVSTDVGTSIQSGGKANITAGHDVNATAAYVGTEKDLSVKAGNDINVKAGKADTYVEERHEYTNSGMLSSTTTVDHNISDKKGTTGSTFSGDTVKMEAGQDVNIIGSNVVGTGDVDITAGRDANITAATETENSMDFHKETTSGIMGSGMGIMIGTQTTKETNTSQNTTKAGSTVGSTNGSVNITAGNTAKVSASDIIVDKDINITGSEVDITSSNETYNNQYKYEQSSTGLTISLGGGTINTIKENILDPLQRATEVTDKRLAALYAGKAGINYAKNIKGTTDATKNLTSKEALVGVSVSFGTSSSEQTSNTNASIAKGSNINAGGNVNITATGKDVNIHGSNVAGENVTLNAKENVNITAAKNTSENISNTESSSMSLGVTMVHGIAPSFSASASMSQEKENTDGTSYTPSTVTANDKLTINSGKDTNIIGSQVKGDRVEGTVGGDLNIESKQDTNTYKESSTSASIGLSSSGVSGGASAGKMNSDYASVTNQAGIYAGDKGFDVNVKGNTGLKGAVIDSTATEDKNKLTTGTLSFSDIKNKAEYNTSGFGFSYDSAATKDDHALLGDKGLIPNIPMSSGDDASSTTKSGVAQGTITITNKDKQKQDIGTLNRDINNTLNKLDQIFNKDTVKERQEMGALFAELSFNAIHELSRDHKSHDPNKKKWSTEQIAFAHALVGLCAGELANSKSSSSVALSAGVNAFVVHTMMKDEKSREYYNNHPEELQWISAAIGSAVSEMTGGNISGGASIAASGTKNNILNLTQYDFYNERISEEAQNRNSKGTILDIHNATKEQDDFQQLDLINALNDYGFCERLDEALKNNPEIDTFEGVIVYGRDISGKIIDARVPENRSNIINNDTALLDMIAQNIVTSVPSAGMSYLYQQASNVRNIKSLSSSPLYMALKKTGRTVDILVFGGNIYTDLTSYDNWQDTTIAIVCDVGAIGVGKAGGAIGGAVVGTVTVNPVAVAVGTYTGTVAGGTFGTQLAAKLKDRYINIKNRGNSND